MKMIVHSFGEVQLTKETLAQVMALRLGGTMEICLVLDGSVISSAQVKMSYHNNSEFTTTLHVVTSGFFSNSEIVMFPISPKRKDGEPVCNGIGFRFYRESLCHIVHTLPNLIRKEPDRANVTMDSNYLYISYNTTEVEINEDTTTKL
jgi:hypothetical protein